MYRDAVVLPQQTWRNILAFVFGRELLPEKDQRLRIKDENDDEEEEKDEEEKKDSDLEKSIKMKKFENLGLWVESNIYFKNFKRIKF